jgi:hypothetical protein
LNQLDGFGSDDRIKVISRLLDRFITPHCWYLLVVLSTGYCSY